MKFFTTRRKKWPRAVSNKVFCFWEGDKTTGIPVVFLWKNRIFCRSLFMIREFIEKVMLYLNLAKARRRKGYVYLNLAKARRRKGYVYLNLAKNPLCDLASQPVVP